MGVTASEFVKFCLSFEGIKESPAGSNNVIFNTNYYGRAVSGPNYPWCCSFVWDMFRRKGISNLFYDGKKTAYCPTVETWGISKKLTVDKTKGQPGDIVLFDFYGTGVSCHIGIIVLKNKDGSYQCIEGNTSLTSNDNGGKVMIRTRKTSQIRCIIRPKYSTTPSTATNTTTKSTKVSTQTKAYKTFVKNLQKAFGFTGKRLDGVAGPDTLGSTITISSKKNSTKKKVNKVVQTYMKALGYYDGKIDGICGAKMTSCINKYQKEVLKYSSCDGEITAKGKMWKSLLKL